MIIILAFFAGIRDSYMLLALFTLCFSTICFGWVTEALSRPDPTSREVLREASGPNGVVPAVPGRYRRWTIGSQHPELLVLSCVPCSFDLVASCQRLGPHVLGWAPFVVIWVIVWDNFRFSIEMTEGGPPDWVYVIIWGEIFVFSSFAIVQILQQATHWGCYNYWLGECLYILLSVVAKGLLGIVLLSNIMIVSQDIDRALVENAPTIQAMWPNAPPPPLPPGHRRGFLSFLTFG